MPNKERDDYISIKHSFPLWLTEKWLSEGYDEELFAAMNVDAPVFVRLNTLKAISLSEKFEKELSLPFSYVYTGGGSAENTEEFKSGKVAVMDLASQKAISDFDIKENLKILDLCSAPGGKSAFLFLTSFYRRNRV